MLPLILLTSFLLCTVNGDENFDIEQDAMQNPDLFGGDMVVDMDEDRNVIPQQHRRWPGGIVPYVIDISLVNKTSLIQKAFDNYKNETCIKFVPRTTENNYIRLFSGKGCYSNVGMIGGQQMVSLSISGCMYVGTIIHELGHAIGFWHEQNRSDRDDYLEIFLENVTEGHQFNFKKLKPSENLLLTPFDYESIMIYGNNAFSKNGKPSMTAKNGVTLRNPYAKQTMTKSDAQRVKLMYKC